MKKKKVRKKGFASIDVTRNRAAAAGFALLVFLCLVGALSLAGKFSVPTTGIIVLPEDRSYSSSWEPYLDAVAETSNLKRVTIKTWSTQDELESLLGSARKENILFAEIPVDHMFRRLEKKGLIGSIEPSLLSGKPYYDAFVRSLKLLVDGDALYALPFSFNPWIALTHLAQDKKPAEALISLPAKDAEGAVAAYGLGAALAGESANKQDVIEIISSLRKSHAFQPNAFTYNAGDAYAFFAENRSKYTFLSMSNFRKLPTEVLLETEIASIPKLVGKAADTIIATGTVIVFPSKSRRGAQAMTNIIALLASPDLLNGITKKRNTLPGTTDTKVRDFHSDRVRNFARNAPAFVFPETFFDSPDLLAAAIEEVRLALATR